MVEEESNGRARDGEGATKKQMDCPQRLFL
jgi:hypothetical protein